MSLPLYCFNLSTSNSVLHYTSKQGTLGHNADQSVVVVAVVVETLALIQVN